MKNYSGTLEMVLNFQTDGDPDEIVNKLLDLFQTIDTNELNLTWDDCMWQVEEDN